MPARERRSVRPLFPSWPRRSALHRGNRHGGSEPKWGYAERESRTELFRAGSPAMTVERVPIRQRLTLLWRSLKWRGGRRGGKKKRTPGAKRGVRSPEIGPVPVLSIRPPILMSGIAYDQFLGIAPAFGERYGDVAAGFIIFPTWSIEHPGKPEQIAAAASAHRERFRNHHLQFICNTEREVDLLKLAGQPAILLNNNFTVSDAIFRPLPGVTVEFDAIYKARRLSPVCHRYPPPHAWPQGRRPFAAL